MDMRLYGMKRKTKGVASDADIEALIENEEEFYCKLCDVYCNSTMLLDTHLNGKKHKAKEAKVDGIRSSDTPKGEEEEEDKQLSVKKEEEDEEDKHRFWCDICKVGCDSGVIMKTHLSGKKHRAKAVSERKMEMKKKGFWCALCEVELNNEVLKEAHVNGKKHRAKEARLGEGAGEGQVGMMANECGERREKGLEGERRNGDDVGVRFMASEGEVEQGSDIRRRLGNGKKRHKDNAENERKGFWCEVCEVEVNSEVMMKVHVNGKKHRAKEARFGGGTGGVCKREEEGEIEMIGSKCEDGDEKGLMEEMGNGDDGGVLLAAGKDEDEDGKYLMEDKANENDEGDHIMAVEEGSSLQGHVGMGKGLMEEKKANEGLQGRKTEGEGEEKEEFWCLGCKVKYDSKASMAKHLKGMEHKAQQALRHRKPINGME